MIIFYLCDNAETSVRNAGNLIPVALMYGRTIISTALQGG